MERNSREIIVGLVEAFFRLQGRNGALRAILETDKDLGCKVTAHWQEDYQRMIPNSEQLALNENSALIEAIRKALDEGQMIGFLSQVRPKD